MSRIDEQLEDRFEHFVRPVRSEGALEDVTIRRRKTARRRRIGAAALAIFVLGATVAGYLALGRAFGDDATPTVPAAPTPGRLLVVAGDTANTSQPTARLEIVALDGSGTQQLIPDIHDYVGPIASSPDGRYIAYSQGDGGPGSSTTILDTATGESRTLGDSGSIGAAWSPDGRRIAYWEFTPSRGSIQVVPADGSGEGSVVTGDTVVVGEPAWSPDGSQIAFEGLDDSGSPWIMVVDLASGQVRKVTPTDGDRDPHPIWDPQGSMIDYAYQGGIWQVAPSAQSVPSLLAGPTPDEVQTQRFPKELSYQSWSPDGSEMAYVVSGIEGGVGPDQHLVQEVYVDALNGTPPTKVASGSNVVWLPVPPS